MGSKKGESKTARQKIKFRQGYRIMRGIILYLDKEQAEKDPRYHECVKLLQLIYGSDPEIWTPHDIKVEAEHWLKSILWGNLIKKDALNDHYATLPMDNFKLGSKMPFEQREPEIKNKIIQFKPKAVSGDRG